MQIFFQCDLKKWTCHEKGGVHRTHNTSTVANKPCRLNYADLHYSHITPNLLTQQHDRPQVSFFSLTIHTCIRQRNFPLHSQHMYNLEITSFLWHQKTHKTTASAKICAQKQIYQTICSCTFLFICHLLNFTCVQHQPLIST
jgi:hypothetical protein